ncbi:407_t:CDS:2 [Ambispora leptoticha]|uniref:407_t:CDS:1 n=1 Tax=Ambispora leptoticha TaxID=144679 RepID=A0A9N9ACA0_9GLOM|nr:407_t:CDS:2 [Ambispora leptoticha]
MDKNREFDSNDKVKVDAKAANTNEITLPTECLHEILLYLVDDKATLLAAAKINRTWCRPLDSITNNTFSSVMNFITEEELSHTFIKCMNDEEREAIFEYLGPTYPSPLFLYTSYIKELDWNVLNYPFTDDIYIDDIERINLEKHIKIMRGNLIMRIIAQTCALIFRTANLEKFVVDLHRTRDPIPAFAKLPNAFCRLLKIERNSVAWI